MTQHKFAKIIMILILIAELYWLFFDFVSEGFWGAVIPFSAVISNCFLLPAVFGKKSNNNSQR
ncbi:ABC maltose/maltodextrin transporter, permease subunit [Fructobacillus tropaeoli]|uniref:ABC maltose/maltodextrin transporter, permease subunit n=1 Tax=Fructobacillus tropaeoli TaxID=709323 RepID=A0A3F3H160_9LACO|nr:ABC maltose/maltodextrin transporter, permease subunit [Fructobacillus tropaeoli]